MFHINRDYVHSHSFLCRDLPMLIESVLTCHRFRLSVELGHPVENIHAHIAVPHTYS